MDVSILYVHYSTVTKESRFFIALQLYINVCYKSVVVIEEQMRIKELN